MRSQLSNREFKNTLVSKTRIAISQPFHKSCAFSGVLPETHVRKVGDTSIPDPCSKVTSGRSRGERFGEKVSCNTAKSQVLQL